MQKNCKPSETGFLISTQGMLEFQAYLLEDRQFTFLLCNRFSHDCLEKFFNVIRSKQCVLNVVQVKNDLKLICVSKHLKNTSRSTYGNIFLYIYHETQPKYEEIKTPAKMSYPVIDLNYSELK